MSTQIQIYIFNRVRNMFGVAEITKKVADKLPKLGLEHWGKLGSDRKDLSSQSSMAPFNGGGSNKGSASQLPSDVRRGLHTTLERLPPIVRLTFTLHKFRGHPTEHISTVLKIRPEDVKRYLARAAEVLSDRCE